MREMSFYERGCLESVITSSAEAETSFTRFRADNYLSHRGESTLPFLEVFRRWLCAGFHSCPVAVYRVAKLKAQTDALRAPEPKKEKPEKKEEVKKAWIGVLVEDDYDEPVSDLKYTLTLPDGSKVSGVTDREGRLLHDQIDSGKCTLILGPWSDARHHEVQDGDCIQVLAKNHRVSPKQILDEPRNQELFKQRKNPHVLHPGDELYIPEGKVTRESLTTDRSHTVRLPRVTCVLRLEVDVSGFSDTSELEFELELEDGSKHKGHIRPADNKSVNFFRVDSSKKAGVLRIYCDPDDKEKVVEHKIKLGHLCPADKVRGIQARLFNLGHYRGKIDEELGPLTKQAIREFLGPKNESREPDLDEVAARLEKVHRS